MFSKSVSLTLSEGNDTAISIVNGNEEYTRPQVATTAAVAATLTQGEQVTIRYNNVDYTRTLGLIWTDSFQLTAGWYNLGIFTNSATAAELVISNKLMYSLY